MRLVSFSHQGRPGIGLLDGGDGSDPDETVIDLTGPAMAERIGRLPAGMTALLEFGLGTLAERLGAKPPPAARLRLAEITLLPPLPRPGKIIGAARNYADGLAELGQQAPAEPVLFAKFASTLLGPGAVIRLPDFTRAVTYEAELAVVIGRRAQRVAVEHARSHIAGYTIFNDVSATDIVRRDGNFLRGKNPDGFGPLGPFLATADEIADPQALRIVLDVDGQVLQESSTARMVFGIDALISHISHAMTLEPGDIIATGTPAGVAAAHTPPAFLRPGSVVTIRIDGLGALSNPVEAVPAMEAAS